MYYEELVKVIMERKWCDELTWMKEAREVLINYYTALDRMSRSWRPPFTAQINDLDELLKFKKNNHGRKSKKKKTWSRKEDPSSSTWIDVQEGHGSDDVLLTEKV